jgi:integrase
MARTFKRNGMYWIDFLDAKGVRHRRQIAPSKRIADEALAKELNAAAREELFGVVDQPNLTFAVFADDWMKRILPTVAKRTRERWKGIVEDHLKPAFTTTLRAIDLAAAEAYIADRMAMVPCKACAGKRPATCGACDGEGQRPAAANETIRAELTVLRHMLKRAVAWNKLAKYPLGALKMPKPGPSRVRWATEDEIAKLLAACNVKGGHVFTKHYLRPYALLVLNSGMRRNEALGLRRKDIDWTNGLARVVITKSGDTANIPLNAVALAALRAVPAPVSADGRYFPFGPNQVSMAFTRAARRAGIDDLHLHDSRHTFASYHAMHGTQQRGLQGLMRHKDPRMTLRYAHLSEMYLREAVKAVEIGVTPPQTARAEDAPASGTVAKPKFSAKG